VSVAPNWGAGKIIEELFEHHCESSIVRPTFVTGHPLRSPRSPASIGTTRI
jgi:lysyl-tRNA synthetase class 2